MIIVIGPPPPPPMQQVIVQTATPSAPAQPASLPSGGRSRATSNRRDRRAREAAEIRAARREYFSKGTRRVARALCEVREVRAVLFG